MSSSTTSDVTAVVLTVGEATTERAIASARRQTLPVRDIVLIEHVTPFHRALNLGAARTRTEFFVQVDADMILDAGCVAALTTVHGANGPHTPVLELCRYGIAADLDFDGFRRQIKHIVRRDLQLGNFTARNSG